MHVGAGAGRRVLANLQFNKHVLLRTTSHYQRRHSLFIGYSYASERRQFHHSALSHSSQNFEPDQKASQKPSILVYAPQSSEPEKDHSSSSPSEDLPRSGSSKEVMAQTAGHVAIPGLTLDGMPAPAHTTTSKSVSFSVICSAYSSRSSTRKYKLTPPSRSKPQPDPKPKGRQSKKPRKKAAKKGNFKNGNVKSNDTNGTSSHSANHPLPKAAAVIHDPSSSSSQTPLSRESTRDPRLPPSAASGGIPDPSPTYLAEVLSSPPSAPLPEPRRILVVIDLNGTLLFRPYRHRPSHFVLRPHAQRFLAYCIDTFHVAIWSSARPENVQRMVAQLLTPEQLGRCVVVWARDKFELSPSDYKMRVQCYKRLSKLWNNSYVRAAHPGAAWGGKWDRTNTVLLDDSIEKARSEPFNILQIPEFVGLHSEPPNVLPQVHDYLNQLSSQVDVSKSMRAQPFALNPSYQLTPEGSDLGLPLETILDHPYR